MLRLELVDNMQGEIIYNYFPEEKEEYGTISMNKETGQLEIKKISENDSHRRYLFHAMKRIEEYFTEKRFLEKDVVAWY